MKILYLGNFAHPWDTENYIATALRQHGHEVLRLEEANTCRDTLVGVANDWQADLFLFAKGRFRATFEPGQAQMREAVRRMRDGSQGEITVASWVFDLMAEDFSRERFCWAAHATEICDALFLTDGHTAKGLRAHVLRQGCPPDHEPATATRDRDTILWLGGDYGERGRQLRSLRDHFGKRVWHVPEGLRGAQLQAEIAAVGAVVGPEWPYYGEYWSNRIYIVTGHGGLFVGPTVPGMEAEGWRAGENYVAYERGSVNSLIDTLEAALRDPQADTIRAAGHALCRERFTYHARCGTLLETLRPIIRQRGRLP